MADARGAARIALLGSAGAFLLAAWLAWPTAQGEAQPIEVLVVDRSASVVRTRPGTLWKTWCRERATDAQERGERLALVAFDEQVVQLIEPLTAARFLASLERLAAAPLAPGAAHSRTVAALAFAGRLIAEHGGQGRVVLLGDGTATDGELEVELLALASRGVACTLVDPPPAELADARLVGLDAPEAVEPGAPLAVRARIELTLGTGEPPNATVRAECVDAQGTVLAQARQQVELQASSACELFLGAAPSQPFEVRAAVELSGDPIPENDRHSVWVHTGDAPRIAWLASPGASATTARALQGLDGLECRPIERGDLARGLGEFDLLLTVDMPPDALSEAYLEPFLRLGGSWFFCAGPSALPGWLRASPTADRLPLEPDPDVPHAQHIVLLVDVSGSMRGAALDDALRAAVELAQRVPPDMEVEVRFCTDRLGPRVVLTADDPEARAARTRELFALQTPGGPTGLARVLEEFARELAGAQRPTLLFLLSDGRDEVGATLVDARRARASLAGIGARLRPFALGPQADLEFLGALCAPGEAPLTVQGASDLTEAFEREASAEQVRQGAIEFTALGAESLPADWRFRELAASRARSAGSARATVRSRNRPHGRTLWLDEQGAPALALAEQGLGAVGAFAGSLHPDWCSDPDSLVRSLDPILRRLARERASTRRTEPRVILQSDELRLSGVPRSWPSRVIAKLDPGDAAPHSRLRFELCLPIQSVGGDGLGERVARVPRGSWPWTDSDRPGLLWFFDPDSGATLATLGFVLPRRGEFDPPWTWPASAPPSVYRAPAASRRHSSAWLALAAGVLGLFAALRSRLALGGRKLLQAGLTSGR